MIPGTRPRPAAFRDVPDGDLVEDPATIAILQGEAMGRPSRLTAEIPVSGGIVVSGTVVRI